MFVKDAPANVQSKLRKWGVADYKVHLYPRPGTALLSSPTRRTREVLSDEFVRSYYRYADQIFAMKQGECDFSAISSGELPFRAVLVGRVFADAGTVLGRIPELTNAFRVLKNPKGADSVFSRCAISALCRMLGSTAALLRVPWDSGMDPPESDRCCPLDQALPADAAPGLPAFSDIRPTPADRTRPLVNTCRHDGDLRRAAGTGPAAAPYLCASLIEEIEELSPPVSQRAGSSLEPRLV